MRMEAQSVGLVWVVVPVVFPTVVPVELVFMPGLTSFNRFCSWVSCCQ